MAKATTIKEALAEFEKAKEKPASECTEVKLLAKIPPIEKMDASLSTLVKCEKLSLSTNAIEKIANLNALKNLKILSLGRNNIKSLTGLEAVGDSLEELWISYNIIEKLKGVSALRKLRVLYMSNNNVKDMGEVGTLGQLPCLLELVFIGNPVCGDEISHDLFQTFKDFVVAKCAKLAKVDGIPVVRQEE